MMHDAPAAPGRDPRLAPRKERALALPPMAQKPRLGLGTWGYRIADAYVSCIVLWLVELAATGIVRSSEFTSFAEYVIGFGCLAVVGLVVLAPAGIVCGTIVEGLARGPRARLAASLGVALIGGGVAFGTATGRHFTPVTRVAFALVVAAISGVVIAILAPRLHALARRAPRTFAAAALAGALVIEVANARVLVRLYPAFHVGLAIMALLVMTSVTWGIARPSSRAGYRSLRVVLPLVLFSVGTLLVPLAIRRLAHSDNVRFIHSDAGPLASQALHLLAQTTEGAEPIDRPPPETAGGLGPTPQLEGYSVLLVTVDAMRADHLGAYGYERKTSPFIDELAAKGARFEYAYSTTPHTSYAITSLHTSKYMRPLRLLGLGDDSETWAMQVQRYGYRTAAFYPPAIFFVDGEKFAKLRDQKLGFEYVKEEFLAADARAGQLGEYLAAQDASSPVFAWVHLFEPHEPYAPRERVFGERDVDRYDAEILDSDRAIRGLVETFRKARPKSLVIVTADHGEEFGEHGGHYHGSTVYEEQVRVPLIMEAAPAIAPGVIGTPVELIDLLPTVLRSLGIPRPARLRGKDLGAMLLGQGTDAAGFAFSETDDMTMIAEGPLRLVCERRVGACRLFNVRKDPGETRDIAPHHLGDVGRLKALLAQVEASHGKYELRGLREEGKAFPEALKRAIAGDGDAAMEVTSLLDDADVEIRRRAAQALFDLKKPETAAALRLSLSREEDVTVRAYVSLTLTRLGEGASESVDVFDRGEARLRRLAALAFAEAGDDRGDDVLVAWWRASFPKHGEPAEADRMEFERAVEVLAALGKLRKREAILPLIETLDDVRLRGHIAVALAKIGDDAARAPLAKQLLVERYQNVRVTLVEALLDLGAEPELVAPLTFLLGLADPLPSGIGAALRADILKHVGGPVRDAELSRLRRLSTSGVSVDFFVPKAPIDRGVRVACRAVATSPGEIRVGRRKDAPTGVEKKAPIPSKPPELDASRSVVMPLSASPDPVEVHGTLPESMGAHPGKQISLVIYATQSIKVDACVLVPLRVEGETPEPTH